MRSGEQFPYKQQVTVVPWGHPSLLAVAVLLTAAPVPARDASYFASVQDARERFASLGARFELVAGVVDLPQSTLVVTDGYGEIHASWTSTERPTWPDQRELVEWLTYIASQCPECSPVDPAWRETTP